MRLPPALKLAAKVRQQQGKAAKAVRGFLAVPVQVIALAALVVIAQHTPAIRNERQAIFERMRAAWQRLWKVPDRDFGERLRIVASTFNQDRLGLLLGWQHGLSLSRKPVGYAVRTLQNSPHPRAHSW
jgi:hypothetical protein